jgi:hypothetical protein
MDACLSYELHRMPPGYMLENAGVLLVKTSICLALRLCIGLSCKQLTVVVLTSNASDVVRGILMFRRMLLLNVVSLEGLGALVCSVECAA